MIDIVKLLKENKDITDFKVNSISTESYENFYVRGKLETVRATQTEDAVVTVYVDGDGVKGDSSFSVYASMSEEEVAKKIADAYERAKLVKNKPYDIPSGDELSVEIKSNFKGCDLPTLAKNIASAVEKADSYTNGSINALEIFIYKEKTSVVNSRGVNKTQTRYRAMIEAIPTWTADGESVELYEAYHFTDFNADEITKEIDERMREVRDRKVAQKLAPCTVNVLLPAREVANLMSEIVDSLNFATVYSRANVFSKGDFIQKDRTGDSISLTACHEIAGSRFSAYFDTDGVTLKDKVVVDNGEVKSYYGSHRFGSYLGEDVTGDLRCISLEKGSLTEDEISKEPYVECVSLSGLQLDLYNDYIGGEIRLAYYYDGEKKVPVTGISMSAKLSVVLNSIRLTEKVTAKDYYKGPEKALLKNMSII
ncbi:MAG: hypothetical protein IJW64_06815 [Clostridia bacterium]|nr:hypothetical protein [Clostridia bacterium]